jgi:hypothetical protein
MKIRVNYIINPDRGFANPPELIWEGDEWIRKALQNSGAVSATLDFKDGSKVIYQRMKS